MPPLVFFIWYFCGVFLRPFNGPGTPTFAPGGTGAGPGGIVTCENRTQVLPEFFPTKRAHLPLELPHWVATLGYRVAWRCPSRQAPYDSVA
uniref:Secreted protein n=1 Tax=Ipomoea trifida TaxID=35884 RepID=A0A959_IPOTF|nr:hypothetical protein [Ipomoea trifida]